MAISSLDDVISGEQPPAQFIKIPSGTKTTGRFYTSWALGPTGTGSISPPGTYSTSLAGANLVGPITGQFNHVDAAGKTTYLSGMRLLSQVVPASSASAMITGVVLCDRLWHNGGFTITSTAAQTINSADFPARDINGTANGDGVLLGLELSVASGAGTPTISVSYTNSEGTSGRTANNIMATTATSVITSFYPIGLQAGDTGVRSVQSLTLSATWSSGTMNLVAYRPIAFIPIITPIGPTVADPIQLGIPKIYANSVPFTIYMTNTTSASPTLLSGTFQESVV